MGSVSEPNSPVPYEERPSSVQSRRFPSPAEQQNHGRRALPVKVYSGGGILLDNVDQRLFGLPKLLEILEKTKIFSKPECDTDLKKSTRRRQKT
jgi:hypothetical protein